MPQPPDAKQLFLEALELPAGERGAFLNGACRGDARLRARVEALLAAEAGAGTFLASPTAGAEEGESSEQAGARIGHYKLQQQIGEGGFGVVWMAEQTQPVRRQVALKVLKRGMDSRAVVARFEQERQALALMDHPSIAKVFDGGETAAGRPYFVMELVRGVPITQFCDKEHLDTRERLRLFVSVCHAVQHAHQKGVIHRDLKPSNVLVTLHDGVAVAKVIDFGIAKAVHRPLTDKTLFTEFQQMVGTPEYMSPEQAELSGLDIDTRADIYALGVLLYELLTGSLPFDVKSRAKDGILEMLRVIREEEPQKPSTRISTQAGASTEAAKRRRTDTRRLTRQLRGDLDWIVLKSLEKDRARRYVSADAFAADVERHLRDEPVEAGPPSGWYRLTKYARRNRVGVLAGAAVTTALLAGLSLAVWGFLEASRERDDAKEQTKLADAARETAEIERTKTAAALGRAETGEAAARKEAARANTVLKLVYDLLTSPDPDQNKGKDYKVRDLLDDFVRELGDSLASEPEVEAAVRELLGKTYLGLGLPDQAEPHVARALELTQQLYGEGSHEFATSQMDEAELLHARAEYRRAAELLEQARPVLADDPEQRSKLAALLGFQVDLYRHLGEYDRASGVVSQSLSLAQGLPDASAFLITYSVAKLLLDQRKLPEAEEVALRGLEQARRAKRGANIAKAGLLLGDIQLQNGKLDAADESVIGALELLRLTHGDEHVDVARGVANLGALRIEQGRPAEAEQVLNEALRIIRKSGHPTTDLSTILSTLARSLRDQGKLQESDLAFQEALVAAGAVEGNTEKVVELKRGLAITLLQLRRFEEAERLLAEVIDWQTNALGVDGHETLTSRMHLALGRSKRRHFAAAEEELRGVLAALEARGERSTRRLASVLEGLSEALSLQGEMDEAEAAGRRALEIRRSLPGDFTPSLAKSMSVLAVAIARNGGFARAEALLREALDYLVEKVGERNMHMAEVQCNLAGILGRMGNVDEAECLFREALVTWEMLSNASGLDWCQTELANVLRRRGKLDEAEDLFQQVLARARTRDPVNVLEIFSTLVLLGMTQLDQGECVAAEATFRESQKYMEANPRQSFLVVSLLGGALAGQGRHEEADPLLREGYEQLRPIPSEREFKRDALVRLIRHYEDWGKPDEATRWRKQLEQLDAKEGQAR